MLFNESTFVATINVLREQYEFDASYSELFSKVLSAEGVPAYDNSKLVNHLFKLLQEQFPPRDGVCEIERYCWDLDFGYVDGVQLISPSDLYHSLMSGKVVMLPAAVVNNIDVDWDNVSIKEYKESINVSDFVNKEMINHGYKPIQETNMFPKCVFSHIHVITFVNVRCFLKDKIKPYLQLISGHGLENGNEITCFRENPFQRFDAIVVKSEIHQIFISVTSGHEVFNSLKESDLLILKFEIEHDEYLNRRKLMT